MKVKIKFFKDNLNKIEKGFKYGLAVALVKSSGLEGRIYSGFFGVEKEEIKAMEREDIENLFQKFNKGGK